MPASVHQDKSPEERLRLLEANCDKVELFKYEKSFTNQDVDQFKSDLSEISLKIEKLETDLLKLKKQYSAQLNPLRKQFTEMLTFIKFRSRQVEEKVYVFLEHDKNQVEYYNDQGIMVHKRMLKFDEMQKTIMSSGRDEFPQDEEEEEFSDDDEDDYDDANVINDDNYDDDPIKRQY